MTRKNFEIGILRLYYVLWATAFATMVVLTVLNLASRGPLHSETLASSGLVLASVVLPGVLMMGIRWVYRGFVPE